ncbi:M16 family metallopeptidase [Sediminitomix flava]|uniref:Zinc protease n=1 Tax=Sediminitomix flava TaxID=379075 RepID=A0A315ZAT4_SEDFL|nr:insulinase family protein [Sediminitomix flava]PWJ41938.1 zinc protease [Sediminitomix flava]
MKISNKVLSAILLIVVFVHLAMDLSAQNIPLNKALTKGKLANGFQYYIQKNEVPKNEVQFRLIIDAGSILEDDTQKGFAHFLEHMAFNGSKHFPDNSLIDYFQSIGVAFGSDINAYTSYDETVYMLPVPNTEKTTLDSAFLFFQDILAGLELKEEAINSERNIIHEEWRTTIGLSERLKKEMYPLLYHNSKYLKRMPIGEMDIVMDESNSDELRRYYKDWYRPNLASLVVIGDIDQEEIISRIEETFGHLENPVNERKRERFTVPSHEETLVRLIQDPEITSLSVKIVDKIPNRKMETLQDLKESVLDLLYTYLVNQRLSDVAQTGTKDFMYAQSYASDASGNKDRYISTATVRSGKVVSGTQDLLNELYRIKKYGFSEVELERKRTILSKELKTALLEQNTLTSAQLAGMLTNHILYDEEYADNDFKKEFVQEVIDKVTLADIQILIDKYIHNSEANRVILVTAPNTENLPSEKELVDAIQEIEYENLKPFESKEVNEPLMATLPEAGILVNEKYQEEIGATTLEFENGARVVLKPTALKNDEIRLTSTRDGGYSWAADSIFDDASMAATLVNLGGLGKFSQKEVDLILSTKQVYLAPFIHRYSEGVSGFSTKEDLETLLQLAHLTFESPRLDKDKCSQFITNKKEYNRNSLNDPETRFADEINKVMMQNSLRTATMLTTEQLDALNFKNSFEFYKERFSSVKGMIFFMVGSFDVEEVKPLIAKYIGSLSGESLTAKFKDHGIRPPKGGIHDFQLNKANKTKVIIRLTGKYPEGQEEKMAIEYLSDILTIKLTYRIREELGGAYAPYSTVTVMKSPYQHYRFDIMYTCDPEKVEELSKATFEEIEKLKEGIDFSDLEKVRKAALNHRKASLETNGFWMKLLHAIEESKEGISIYNNYEDFAEGITIKQLQKIAKKYLKEEKALQFSLSPLAD